MPRIAIVTPSFQQGRFIKRTIESVLTQNVNGVEYFVADGGSSDETTGILQQYDRQIRWVSEKDRGQAHAVNKAIAATTAPVIGWLNSDDLYCPNALSTVLSYFDAHPEADVVYGEADHIGENDELLEPYPTEDWNTPRLLETCFLCQPAVFFRRSVVERWGMLDERLQYCMDYEYWIRLGRAGAAFARINQKLACSRMYASNKTLGATVRVHAETNDMFRRSLGAVPARWILNYAHAVVRQNGTAPEESLSFVVHLCIESWKASLRWNRSLPREIIETTFGWVRFRALEKWRNGKQR